MPLANASLIHPSPAFAIEGDAYAPMSGQAANAIVDQAEDFHITTPHKKHPWLHYALWTAGAAAAALVALPYLGETLFGAAGSMASMDTFTTCSTKGGLEALTNPAKDAVGMWAPGIQGLIAAVPGLALLATGGWVTAAASVAIGVGGYYLAKHFEKQEALDPSKFKWSKVVRTVALCSSLLISLPGILTGLSMGVQFLASLSGSSSMLVAPAGTGNLATEFVRSHARVIKEAATWSWAHMGGVGMVNAQASGVINSTSYLLPHIFSCVAPLAAAGAGAGIHSNAMMNQSASFSAREWNRAAEPGMQKGMR